MAVDCSGTPGGAADECDEARAAKVSMLGGPGLPFPVSSNLRADGILRRLGSVSLRYVEKFAGPGITTVRTQGLWLMTILVDGA